MKITVVILVLFLLSLIGLLLLIRNNSVLTFRAKCITLGFLPFASYEKMVLMFWLDLKSFLNAKQLELFEKYDPPPWHKLDLEEKHKWCIRIGSANIEEKEINGLLSDKNE